jgi:hypothetical protein
LILRLSAALLAVKFTPSISKVLPSGSKVLEALSEQLNLRGYVILFVALAGVGAMKYGVAELMAMQMTKASSSLFMSITACNTGLSHLL